jgi:ribosomal protein S18 acetylase RimI-like enzyme
MKQNECSVNEKFESIKIRKGQSRDLKDIAKLFRIESAKAPYNERYSKKIVEDMVAAFFNADLYVAEDGKEIVGFVYSYKTAGDIRKAYVGELWLKAKCQRCGIGRKLMDTIEYLYKRKGVKIIRLAARKKATAFKFYKKLEYKEYRELVFLEKEI